MSKLKGIALVSFLFVLGVQSKHSRWSDICAHESDGTRLPLPLDCKRFVLCLQREVAAIRSCPRGLHFNAKLGECDFQWRADCSGLSLYATADNDEECTCTCCADECNSSEEGTTATTPCNPEEETTTTPKADEESTITNTPEEASTGTFETDPSESSSQTPPVESSTAESGPGESSSQSPPVESSTSESPPLPSSTTSAPGSLVPAYCANKQSDCVDKPDGAMIPVSGVCTNYFQCTHGCCQEFNCPGGLYFNNATKMCDYFWNVDCQPAAGPDASDEIVGPSGTTCSSQGVCARQRDGVMIADPDSNGYFMCQCQCPIAMPCDPKTKFNETAQVCDWDKSSTAVDVLCPDGLVYNATSNECDYPEGYVPKVECNNDSIECQGQPDGTLLPVEGVCNKFYKCSFNCAVEMICPNNLVYDPKQEYCDYPTNYQCQWPYTPPSGPNAGPSGIACEDHGRCLGKPEGTYLPSKTSCSGYSVCQCECEIERQCPEGLYWDTVLETCNHQINVKCTL